MNNIEGLKNCRLTCPSDIVTFWPFFRGSVGELNEIVAQRGEPVTEELLFRVICDCLVERPEASYINVITSKNDKPLAYHIGFDNTHRYSKTKSFLTYALYSNKKSKTASRYAAHVVEQWAKGQGYEEIHAFSPRTSGAFLRFMQRFFGMRLKLIYFSKSLCTT